MGNSLQKPDQNPQQQERDEQNNSSIFTCEICVEPMLETQKFTNINHCRHPFCLDCMAKYIEVKLQDKTPNIACPGLNCGNQLDPSSCKEIISPTLFVTWCDLLCDGLVSWSDSSFCPNKDCRELVVNECGEAVKEARCPNCKDLFCFLCKIRWVDGHGCHETSDDQNLRDRNDLLFKELIEKKRWAQCPGCGRCVERLRGCFLIKCRCLTRFCYNCGKKLSNGSCDCILEGGNVDDDDDDDIGRYVYLGLMFLATLIYVPLVLYMYRHNLESQL